MNSIKDLFLAHHADDQLETILFRLAKGSGLDGLCGMRHIVAFDDTLTLHRPLLGMEKHALMATCAAHNAPIVHDPSNHNPAYARPRLRQALAEEGLSVKRLVKTTERLQRAQTALDHYAQDFVLNHCVKSDGYRIDIHQLKSTPFEIVVRVMKVLMDEINPDHSARMEKVETLCETVVNDQDGLRCTYWFVWRESCCFTALIRTPPRGSSTAAAAAAVNFHHLRNDRSDKPRKALVEECPLFRMKNPCDHQEHAGDSLGPFFPQLRLQGGNNSCCTFPALSSMQRIHMDPLRWLPTVAMCSR